ncbi:MAG: 23S rRNA (adenine(2503)-C(2))-methyltransferase RlmN, partial [Acidobacteria bacterium]|nr:23S rRNA (adenine(2503)-C(2))-methyltransferase RlmN [Acidobacteriota bacterium]
MSGVGASRYDPDRAALSDLLDGEPGYRIEQLWEGLYRQGRPLEEITGLPGALRSRLADALPTALEAAAEQRTDDGATTKWLWRLRDGAAVETVLMHYDDRTTVCVSTQAGCAMACGFCATGQAGFERQLGVGEIVEQVVRAQWAAGDRRVSNVVFMGMGEPLANFRAVVPAIRILLDDLGFDISRRRVTLSTSGLVPQMYKLAEEVNCALAVSLHAPDDALRNELVPINRIHPIAELLEACWHYIDEQNGRSVTFEYVMLDGVNDQLEHARALARLMRGRPAKLNLIPFNPFPGTAYRRSP